MNTSVAREPWNKGKLVGQKAPLRLRDIWSIRVRLQIAEKTRDLALFNLAIDSKLRACDLTKLRVRDIAHGAQVSSRAIVMQQKTHRPVQFEITEQTRTALEAWIHKAQLRSEDFLFPSRLHASAHLSIRQYESPPVFFDVEDNIPIYHRDLSFGSPSFDTILEPAIKQLRVDRGRDL